MEHRKQANTLIDKKNVDRQRWFDLLTSSNFSVIEDYFNTRIKVLSKENEELAESGSLDSHVKIGSNQARINEIKAFFSKVNFKKHELVNKKEK